jgi:N-acetylglucosaminyldiphosphoundecaprenol N-acetyl-beta-D-mannosaminyltransferase
VDSPAAVVGSAVAADPVAVAADSASRPPDRLEILGIAIDRMRRSEVERRIVARLTDSNSDLLHIATVNPEYMVAAHRDRVFREALLRAQIGVPDGVGIVWAARALCSEVIGRVTGVELVESLFTLSAVDPPRIFLLGNAASIAELQGRHPTRVVGRWGYGSAAAGDDRESIERIRERDANVVLVGYGAPGQVLWIERNRAALTNAGVTVAIGVGGALDFAAGTVERAPRFVQRLGLEWLYRLLRERWRWRRQLTLPIFVVLVVRAWIMQRRHGAECACRILAHDDAPNQSHNR